MPGHSAQSNGKRALPNVKENNGTSYKLEWPPQCPHDALPPTMCCALARTPEPPYLPTPLDAPPAHDCHCTVKRRTEQPRPNSGWWQSSTHHTQPTNFKFSLSGRPDHCTHVFVLSTLLNFLNRKP